MRRILVVTLIATGSLVGVGAAIWIQEQPASSATGQISQPPKIDLALPEFDLVDAAGQNWTHDEIKDQIVVVDFFFTNCPDLCPMMSRRMAQIQRSLPEAAPVMLLSITVDPEKDTPEKLKKYAEMYGAKDGRWLFLTGEKERIIDLARNGFKLGASDDPADHSPRLTLVNKGRIVGYYESTNPKSVALLQREINSLIRQQ